MQIDNGITDRERAEVLEVIEKILAKDERRLEDSVTRSGYIFAQGCVLADREILDYLRKRWQA